MPRPRSRSSYLEKASSRLALEPRGKSSKTLLRRGKVKLHPTITYTPAGGTANAVQTAITLKEKVRG